LTIFVSSCRRLLLPGAGGRGAPRPRIASNWTWVTSLPRHTAAFAVDISSSCLRALDLLALLDACYEHLIDAPTPVLSSSRLVSTARIASSVRRSHGCWQLISR